MIIKQKKSVNKKLLIIVAIAILAVAIGIYAYLTKPDSTSRQKGSSTSGKVNYGGPTDEEIRSGQAIKDKSINGSVSGSDSNPAPTYSGGTSKGIVTLLITSANQSDGLLKVRTLIQANTNEGTCTLTLTRDAQAEISATAGVQASAQTSTCKGFDVDTSTLAKGMWTLSIAFSNSTLQASQTMSIRVE